MYVLYKLFMVCYFKINFNKIIINFPTASKATLNNMSNLSHKLTHPC